MARTSVAGFVGPSNRLRSVFADPSRTINLYLEQTAPGVDAARGQLLATPGLVPYARVADSPGATIFYQDDRAFAVVGSTFAEVNTDGTTTSRGTVAAATLDLPSTIVSNGTAGGQLLICSGGHGYVFTLLTNAFIEVDNANFPGTAFPAGNAVSVDFMDGYGFVLTFASREWHLSALEDFTSWDALDVAQRSEGSDNLVGMRRNHREVWFFGSKTGEVWYDSGDALFPFAPVPGVFIETGAISPQIVRVGDTLAWFGQDERGLGGIYLANGYEPKRISTPAVERMLETSSEKRATILFAQQQQAHVFLWVTVPDLETTWVYDLTTGAWHERAIWDPVACVWTPHLASALCWARIFSPPYLVTDRTSGVIYALDLTTYTDIVG